MYACDNLLHYITVKVSLHVSLQSHECPVSATCLIPCVLTISIIWHMEIKTLTDWYRSFIWATKVWTMHAPSLFSSPCHTCMSKHVQIMWKWCGWASSLCYHLLFRLIKLWQLTYWGTTNRPRSTNFIEPLPESQTLWRSSERSYLDQAQKIKVKNIVKQHVTSVMS